jgi:hypothetical protein
MLEKDSIRQGRNHTQIAANSEDYHACEKQDYSKEYRFTISHD